MAATTAEQKAELACAYAALILADGDIKITPDKLQTVIEAAGIKDVPAFWTKLFAKVLEKKDINDLIMNASSSVAPAASTSGDAASAPEGAAEATKEEAKEKSEESEGDLGIDLFG